MFDPPRGHTKSNPEDDGTAVGGYEWSGVELDADEVFSEFPSENVENIVPAISHDLQASKRSALLVSACSFVVGVVAGAVIVWLSGRPSHERPDVQVAQAVTPALPAETSPAPANQSTAQVPARSVLPPARRPAFRGSLIVNSRPPGARVLLNGRRAGMTPLVLKNQSVGSRAVRLELDGYEAWTSAVQVVTNTSTRVRADLKPARALLEPPESQSASAIGTPSR